jgi:integrase/DNA-binding CsgD family transcriptional regulator
MASIRKRKWSSPAEKRAAKREGRRPVKDCEAWQLDYRDQFGKRHQPQFERKKDAEAELTRIKDEVRKGTHTADRDTWTLGKACQTYIDHIAEQHRLFGSPSWYTVKGYGGVARRNIVPAVGGLKLNTPRIWLPLQKFIDDTAKADLASPHGEVKHDKLGLIKIVINQSIKFAVEKGKLNANPLRDHWLKLPKREPKQIEIPTKEETQRFAAALQRRPKWMREITYRNAVVIMNLACYTPMREGEICALWWEDIDWQANEIATTRNLSLRQTPSGPVPWRTTTKTRAGIRKCPMLPQLRELLLKHAAARGCALTGYVLVVEDGAPVTPNLIATVHWPGIARAAGLLRQSKRKTDGKLYWGKTPKYHFHALRHFGASLLIEQGINPYHLMRIMGHNDIKVTFNTYGHLFATDTEIRDKMTAGLDGFQLPQLPDRTMTVSLTGRDEDGRAKVAELRAQNKSRREIAAILGVPPWQVSRWDDGTRTERRQARDAQIIELASEGKSPTEIAPIVGLTVAGVRARLKAHGVNAKAAWAQHDADIIRLRASGLSVTDTALTLGIPYRRVWGRLAALGKATNDAGAGAGCDTDATWAASEAPNPRETAASGD